MTSEGGTTQTPAAEHRRSRPPQTVTYRVDRMTDRLELLTHCLAIDFLNRFEKFVETGLR